MKNEEVVELSEWLKKQSDKFETKKKMFVFSELVYKPTGEKVIEGFRYFNCSIEDLLAAFESGDLGAISALEFAVDDEGDVDTSSVCLLLAYTQSGAFLAAQPQEYQDYSPTLLREPKMLSSASSLGEAALSLDQSS